MSNLARLQVADEVSDAIGRGAGVVALESTLITHGLPHPENLATARESEAAVRAAGAVPATIAVIGGTIRVGLSDTELEAVARSSTFQKASRRDLAAMVAGQHDAGLTVSATLRVARLAGIRLMATGGIGGVHRDAGRSFDVSTDLEELARADGQALVCSGAKSILDLPATLEVLETLGVPVIGYRTNTFPAFTTPSSGLPLSSRADTPEALATIIRAHRALGQPGAVLIAQAVDSAVGIDRDTMEAAISRALRTAEDEGVRGQAVTPFLLDQIREATDGRSLAANRALIVANARLAGELAATLAVR